MKTAIRVFCWNIAEASNTGAVAANGYLDRVGQQIASQTPDLVLLNEVRHWDLWVGGWLGGSVRQTEVLASIARLPNFNSAPAVRMGWTGHKVNSIITRYPLGPPLNHPIRNGSRVTGYAILQSSLAICDSEFQVFSTRFDAHSEADNIAAHQQAKNLVKSIDQNAPIVFAGDFNASVAHDPQFNNFIGESGLTKVAIEYLDQTPCLQPGLEQQMKVIDHIFYRGNFGIREPTIRCPWPGTEPLSEHAWLFVELVCPPEGFAAHFGSDVKLKHLTTGALLHSHTHMYGHGGTSGQQQVTGYMGYDGNDYWRIRAKHGELPGARNGEVVKHADIIRLTHVATGRNLHSHAGYPSPASGQQEVTAYGEDGEGDENDNWLVEVEGGGSIEVGKNFKLVHSTTGCTLHSHLGFGHVEWTMGQQEVTCYPDRDDNDFWRLVEVR